MNWKKIAILTAAATALGAAAPAFADPAHWAPAHGHRYWHHAPAAIASHGRPGMVARLVPVAYYPAPVAYGPPLAPRFHGYRGHAAEGALAGALAGALIGGSIAHDDQRAAAIAIGSLLGAVIGHELAGGH